MDPTQPPLQSDSWRTLVEDHEGPPEPWPEMDGAARKIYMTEVVVPRMSDLFIAFDGERYAAFSCKTCHGPNARTQAYAMPNPTLPILYPSGSAEQKQTVAEHEEAARFMFNAVTPSMRQILGLPRYDRDTGEGFSCFYCHPRGDPETDRG